MSYNPNQQYNPALRRDAVQSGGDPYQSQQQFAVQQGQAGYHPADNRVPAQQGNFARQQQGSAAAISNDWDPFSRQGGAPAYQPQPSAQASQYIGGGGAALRNPAGAYNPNGQQQPAAGQYRPQAQGAPTTYSAPQQYQQQGGGAAAIPGAGYNSRGSGGADVYYPEGQQNGAGSLSSLKQTLAQTISNLAAASASGNPGALGASGATGGAGQYAPQGYEPAYGGRAPVTTQQPQYAPQQQQQQPAAYADPNARSYAPASVGGRYAPVAYSPAAGAPRGGPGNLAPLDVRYQQQAQAGTGPQQRYNAPAAVAAGAMDVDRGGYPGNSSSNRGGGDPPVTGGFYNRRPAPQQQQQQQQQDPLGPQGGIQQQLRGGAAPRDYAYDLAAGPYNPALQQPQQQQAYVPNAAPAARAAYQPQQQYQQQTIAPSFSPEHHPSEGHYGAPHQQYSNPAAGAPVVSRRGGFDPAAGAYLSTAPQQQYAPAAGGAPFVHRVPVARNSKWSERLMDPLDLTDGLLQNSVHTHTIVTAQLLASGPSAASAGAGAGASERADRHERGAGRRGGVAHTVAAPRDRDNDLARYGPAPGAAAVSNISPAGSKRARRDRSASPSSSHAAISGRAASSSAPRSRSPSAAANRSARSAAEPVRRTSGLPFGARPPRPLTYATSPIANLIADFNLPAVGVSSCSPAVAMRAVDLFAKFPKLYVPNDLVSVRVDAAEALKALEGEIYSNLINTVPIVMESNNPALVPAGQGQEKQQHAPVSDILDPPKFTYTQCCIVNNTVVVDPSKMPGHFSVREKPVKHQVRVLVCCGVKDPEGERIDHNLPQKLRVLCGRRKGNMLLLGCPWSQDLDADGDTSCNPVVNPSCLLRTVQRALLAQALLKIPLERSTSSSSKGSAGSDHGQQVQYRCEGLVRLCEVHYHRPVEEIHGKTYPEQEEFTTIFMYTVQPSLLAQLSAADLDQQYRLMSARVVGTSAGPRLNRSLPDWEREFAQMDQQQQEQLEAGAGQAEGEDERVGECVQTEKGVRMEEYATEAEAEVFAGDPPVDGAVKEEKEEEDDKESLEMNVDASDSGDAEVSAPAPAPAPAPAAASTEDEIIALMAEVAGAPVASTVETVDMTAPPTVVIELSSDSGVSSDGAALTQEHKVAASTHAASGRVRAREAPPKPSEPSLMLCPMPLSAEASADAVKKQDGLALRLLPLHSMLAYTLEDRSERLFETSVAAELVRSMLSVNYANLVTDFILAEHPVLNALCDLRVLNATAKLRAMIAGHRTRISAKGASTRNRATATTAAGKPLVAAHAAGVEGNGKIVAPASTTEGTSVVKAEPQAVAEAEAEVTFTVDTAPSADNHHVEGAALAGETAVEAGANEHKQEQQEGAADGEAMQEEQEEEDHDEKEKVEDRGAQQTEEEQEQQQEQHQGEKEGELLMSETEARLWRRRFVSAARWFDLTDELCLHYEHLKMILFSSTRNLSRADVEDALDRVCKSDILRYETFI